MMKLDENGFKIRTIRKTMKNGVKELLNNN